MTPRFPSYPSMVCVFPLPVWPYAKTHTLRPSITLWMRGCTSSNTSSCVAPPLNTRSYSYVFFTAWSSRDESSIMRWPQSVGNATASTPPASSSLWLIGRTRQKTRMMPFSRIISLKSFRFSAMSGAICCAHAAMASASSRCLPASRAASAFSRATTAAACPSWSADTARSCCASRATVRANSRTLRSSSPAARSRARLAASRCDRCRSRSSSVSCWSSTFRARSFCRATSSASSCSRCANRASPSPRAPASRPCSAAISSRGAPSRAAAAASAARTACASTSSFDCCATLLWSPSSFSWTVVVPSFTSPRTASRSRWCFSWSLARSFSTSSADTASASSISLAISCCWSSLMRFDSLLEADAPAAATVSIARFITSSAFFFSSLYASLASARDDMALDSLASRSLIWPWYWLSISSSSFFIRSPSTAALASVAAFSAASSRCFSTSIAASLAACWILASAFCDCCRAVAISSSLASVSPRCFSERLRASRSSDTAPWMEWLNWSWVGATPPPAAPAPAAPSPPGPGPAAATPFRCSTPAAARRASASGRPGVSRNSR